MNNNNENTNIIDNEISLKEKFYKSKILIVIEKKCGFQLLVPVLENALLIDLYRYIELYYNHIQNEPLNIYFKVQSFKKFLPRNNTSVIDFIRDNYIKPFTKYPSNVMYKFYLDICDH